MQREATVGTCMAGVQPTVTRYPPKLHVWAAAGYYFKTKLYFVTENMNQTLYQRITKANLKEKNMTCLRLPQKIKEKLRIPPG